jgi:hypothetical protein
MYYQHKFHNSIQRFRAFSLLVPHPHKHGEGLDAKSSWTCCTVTRMTTLQEIDLEVDNVMRAWPTKNPLISGFP